MVYKTNDTVENIYFMFDGIAGIYIQFETDKLNIFAEI